MAGRPLKAVRVLRTGLRPPNKLLLPGFQFGLTQSDLSVEQCANDGEQSLDPDEFTLHINDGETPLLARFLTDQLIRRHHPPNMGGGSMAADEVSRMRHTDPIGTHMERLDGAIAARFFGSRSAS